MTIPKPIDAPGVRLLVLSSVAPFQHAPRKYRTLDAGGQEIVDLAAIFADEHAQRETASRRRVTLSAEKTRQFRRPDGTVDLAAIFNDEAAANGLAK